MPNNRLIALGTYEPGTAIIFPGFPFAISWAFEPTFRAEESGLLPGVWSRYHNVN
jgi:hypothetical protein